MSASHLAPLNPDPSTIGYGESSRASRGHHRSIRRGRVMVLMIFAGIIALDATGLAIGSATPSFASYMLATSLVAAVSALWTAVFLVAVWYRQVWARYVLFGLECLTIGAALLLFPEAVEPGADLAQKPALLCIAGLFLMVHVGIAWMLMYSHDLKRLTTRAHL